MGSVIGQKIDHCEWDRGLMVEILHDFRGKKCSKMCLKIKFLGVARSSLWVPALFLHPRTTPITLCSTKSSAVTDAILV